MSPDLNLKLSSGACQPWGLERIADGLNRWWRGELVLSDEAAERAAKLRKRLTATHNFGFGPDVDIADLFGIRVTPVMARPGEFALHVCLGKELEQLVSDIATAEEAALRRKREHAARDAFDLDAQTIRDAVLCVAVNEPLPAMSETEWRAIRRLRRGKKKPLTMKQVRRHLKWLRGLECEVFTAGSEPAVATTTAG